MLDISRKATVAQVGEKVVSRCFAGCLVQARNRCSNRCFGLRNYESNVRPINTLAAGVESPSQTLAPGVVFCTVGLKYQPFDPGGSSLVRHVRY